MSRVISFDGKTEIITSSVEETLSQAGKLARLLEPGDVIALSGEMGSGKTHFVKGIVAGLDGNPDQVDSPTFAIVNEYEAGNSVYHMDCYRLGNEEEASVIGLESYFDGSGICLIEWPDRIEGMLPAGTIRIYLHHESETKRRLTIESGS